MQNPLKKIREDKKAYKERMAVVDTLPEDYQFVFHKIHDYIWSFAGGSGMDMLQTEYDLIGLFAEAAESGLPVLDVTGKDVAGFCDELIRDNKSWMDSYRRRLDEYIAKKGKRSDR